MARKGRARRFREARELKQGFNDGLFSEGNKTLADVDESDADDSDEWDDEDEDESWDPDDPLNDDPLRDESDRQAS